MLRELTRVAQGHVARKTQISQIQLASFAVPFGKISPSPGSTLPVITTTVVSNLLPHPVLPLTYPAQPLSFLHLATGPA